MGKIHNSDKTNFDVYFEEINEMFQPDAAQQFVYLTGAAGTGKTTLVKNCLLYTSPSPRDQRGSRMPSSA